MKQELPAAKPRLFSHSESILMRCRRFYASDRSYSDRMLFFIR